MAYNIADLFERVVDAVPDRLALIDRDDRLTFADLDELTNRIGHHLAAAGIGPGDHVGIYGYNSTQWVAAMLGCFKIRAIPINVNFRYVADELAYIFDNAKLVGLIYDQQFAPLIEDIRDRAPGLRTLVHVADGSGTDTTTLGSTSWDDAVDAASGARDFPERSPDDLYVLYTGGTTGMPKGVMWRQEDVFMALGGGIDALSGERVTSDSTLAERAAANEIPLVFLVIPPLMHGAAQWGTLSQMLQGNTVVLLPKFSAEAAWSVIERERVNASIITGDAMARPMIELLDEDPARYDTSSVISLSSSAAIFSSTVKDRFLERFPNLIITDSIGSSESGFNGLRMVAKGDTQMQGGPTVSPGPDVVVLDDDLRVIETTDPTVGRLGRGGNIPLGYFDDPEKTASTFVTAANGRRYAVSGDFARWEPDGSITLLGRGSTTINTGGEKVHPEEVEQAVKDHPAVYDCLVVGVPDDRWGQRVTAVAQFRDGMSATVEEIADHVRRTVAGYKVPRGLVVVDEIVRSPSGKPDYPWAQRVATGQRT